MTIKMIRWCFNNKLLLILGVATFCFTVSTDAQTTDSYRLPKSVAPTNYTLKLTPDLENKTYDGEVTIALLFLESSKVISVNVKDLEIKTITVSNTSNTNISVVSTNFATKTEILQITLQDEIPANATGDLFITFTGKLDGNDGLYEGTLSNGDKFIAAAFKPGSARAAFPNFDEPGFKAKFKLIINKPKNYVALSNMEAESNTTDSASNTDVVTFTNTLDMSSYQIAVFLSTFDSKKTVITDNGAGKKFDLISYAQKSQIEYVKFSQDIATRAIPNMVKYFNSSYSSSKLGLLAIPEYKDEVSEQWGLTTFRESLFALDTETASSNNKKTIALNVIRGLSYYWMGNQVTPKWWSDNWVNEGSTLYFAYLFVNQIEPNWTLLDQFPTRTMHSALDTDATLSSHPLVQNVETPSEIAASLDSISSEKGASIIRMMQGFIGEDNYRSGMQDYIKNNAYKNAGTEEFLSSLETHFKKNNAINATLRSVMDTWINEPGYPVITMKVGAKNNTFVLTQTRFLQTANTTKSNSSWYIPITYKTNKGVNEGVTWFPNIETSITLTPRQGITWLKLNNNQEGYYRVNYEEDMWQKLTKAMTEKSEQLTAADRAHVLNDVFALANANSTAVSYATALNVTTSLKNETEFVPIDTYYYVHTDLLRKLSNTTALDNYKRYCQYNIKYAYNKTNWKKTPKTVLEGSTEARILNLALDCGLKDAEELVRSEFTAYLNSTENKVDPTRRYYVYYFGMKDATQAVWDKMSERYLNETDTQEQFKLRAALTAPATKALLQRCLEFASDQTKVKGTQFLTFLTLLSANPAGEDLVWDYTRANWTQLVERYTVQSKPLGDLILSITSGFKTETRLKEMNEFFTTYPEAGVGATSRAKALEIVRSNANWTYTNEKTVASWLEAKVKSENL